MLVRIESDRASFVMLGDSALKLLRMAGHSGTVPGAIPADGVASALARLEAAVGQAADAEDVADEARRDDEKDDERRVPVTLRQRAFPLLELMRGAVSSGSGVRWRKG